MSTVWSIDRVREQFPSLLRPAAGDTLPVFVDNPAGTQVPQRVIDAVRDYYLTMNANAGGTFATSQRTDAMVRDARAWAAAFLNAPSPDEIVFGPNMTTLNFALSRALAQQVGPGDEVVVTRMDHDANVMPWLRIAEDRGLTVRWVDIHTDDATLDLDSLEAALTDKTRIVATVHASNAVGTINPVRRIADMVHATGAYYVVDAVQSAPHVSLDVQALDCDFLLCSAYKFYGPHIGILWGRYDLLAELPAYKVRPAKDKPPFRWETGTPSFETIHGVAAALEYLAWLGSEFGGGADGSPAEARRARLERGMDALRAYEQGLVTRLIDGLLALPDVTVAGITDPARVHERVPTVVFVQEGATPQEIAAYLAGRHIYVWHGDYYALEIMQRLGHGEHGMVRVGLGHYNTADEIDRLLTALAERPR